MSNNLGLTFKLENPVTGGVGTSQDVSLLEDFCNTKLEFREEKTILVVLLGWTGAKDVQLAKFSEIYSHLGYITLRCIIPPQVVYSDISRLPNLAAEVLKILRENHLESHPTFFHVISNGGAYLYSYIVRELALQENKEEFDIRGTIFDSAPYSPTATSAYRAIKMTCNAYRLCGMALGSVIASAVVLAGMLKVFWVFNKLAWECFTVGTFKRLSSSGTPTETYPLANFITRIWKMKNHSFAFLYSEADIITPWQEVEEIAVATRNHGNLVELVKFMGSDHMLHFRTHPQEYSSTVSRFIRNTMESYRGPTVFWDE